MDDGAVVVMVHAVIIGAMEMVHRSGMVATTTLPPATPPTAPSETITFTTGIMGESFPEAVVAAVVVVVEAEEVEAAV